MRKTTISNVQGCLPLQDARPILDVLRPVKIDNWREDGLFSDGKYSVGRKIKFVIAVRAAAFDYAPRELCEAKGQSRVPRIEIITDKMMRARRMFDAVMDAQMRDVMVQMILREDLLSAHYMAQICGYRWPQFVLDFNKGLEQAITYFDSMRRAK